MGHPSSSVSTFKTDGAWREENGGSLGTEESISSYEFIGNQLRRTVIVTYIQNSRKIAFSYVLKDTFSLSPRGDLQVASRGYDEQGAPKGTPIIIVAKRLP